MPVANSSELVALPLVPLGFVSHKIFNLEESDDEGRYAQTADMKENPN